MVPIEEDASNGVWENIPITTDDPPEQEKEPEASARFATVPAELLQSKHYSQLSSALKDCVYRNYRYKARASSTGKEFAKSGESDADFRKRLAPAQGCAARCETSQAAAGALKKIEKAKQRAEKLKSHALQRWFQVAISMFHAAQSAH